MCRRNRYLCIHKQQIKTQKTIIMTIQIQSHLDQIKRHWTEISILTELLIRCPKMDKNTREEIGKIKKLNEYTIEAIQQEIKNLIP